MKGFSLSVQTCRRLYHAGKVRADCVRKRSRATPVSRRDKWREVILRESAAVPTEMSIERSRYLPRAITVFTEGWLSRGDRSNREAKGGALRLSRVAERRDKFPGSCVCLL